MNQNASLHPTDTTDTAGQSGQLSLLPDVGTSTDNPRFRLGKDTCERGLRNVAQIKEMLARRQRERELAEIHHLPPRQPTAA